MNEYGGFGQVIVEVGKLEIKADEWYNGIVFGIGGYLGYQPFQILSNV